MIVNGSCIWKAQSPRLTSDKWVLRKEGKDLIRFEIAYFEGLQAFIPNTGDNFDSAPERKVRGPNDRRVCRRNIKMLSGVSICPGGTKKKWIFTFRGERLKVFFFVSRTDLHRNT